jgi:membrane-associated phospholipid phosphatase
MGLKEKVWMALAAVSALLIIAVGYWPYFPGDVGAARLVQSIAPASIGWAKWISSTAKSPWDLILLAVTVGISWKLAGWRAALLALASFAGMWVLGKWLGPLPARPRPSPDLVHVAQKLSGYSFPSVFALTYASTIGFLAILFVHKGSGMLRTGVVVASCVLMLMGGAGRIVLGAHWPSDLGLSYLIGLLWACLLVRFV